jgi:hypothetical protein
VRPVIAVLIQLVVKRNVLNGYIAQGRDGCCHSPKQSWNIALKPPLWIGLRKVQNRPSADPLARPSHSAIVSSRQTGGNWHPEEASS